MNATSIRNVNVPDVNGLQSRKTLTFATNPGDVLAENAAADSELDGTGCTMIAGLIDAKVDTHGSTDALDQFAPRGVTTVMDLSSTTGQGEAMRRAAAESPGAPSFFFSATIMGSSHGTPLAIFPFWSMRRVSTRDEAVEYVESTMGGDGGDGSHLVTVVVDQPGLDSEVLSAVTETAHRHEKLVVGHASQVAAYRLALETGCDIIMPLPLDGSLDEETVTAMARRGVGVIPTLSFLRKAMVERRMPQVAYDHAVAALRTLHRAGVAICAGSSSTSYTGEGGILDYGTGLTEELRLLETDGGMSRAELLRAATSTPAALFRLQDRGVLEEGRRADMVLLRGSPLEDAGLIDMNDRILRVWVHGVEVERRV
ncbi:hypothetical protein CP532_0997 [Ophiocordyceps camponoti-leonardi (nom. inval.)]|nr:hypothetical protein CP532_0997 [Ophiocordyceps camponoti-leonardi (nom. inval.)]